MKSTRGMPLVVPQQQGKKMEPKKHNTRTCEVVHLKIIRLRHILVKGLWFKLLSRFCCTTVQEPDSAWKTVWQPSSSYKTVKGYAPLVYTTRWGAYPLSVYKMRVGWIVQLPQKFFRQPGPYYKRIQKGFAHKFCLQNSPPTKFYLQTGLTLHHIASQQSRLHYIRLRYTRGSNITQIELRCIALQHAPHSR